jgi:hypothetical protein
MKAVGEASPEALIAELREARRVMRGNILRGRALFECPAPTCPVRAVKVDFVEEAGVKPMQGCRCPRCGGGLVFGQLDIG